MLQYCALSVGLFLSPLCTKVLGSAFSIVRRKNHRLSGFPLAGPPFGITSSIPNGFA